ncbi:MAG: sugar transferase [Gemmatimonadaceae bacterium]|nr:sugar transferase [Gemmatimonadaceae bacterium]
MTTPTPRAVPLVPSHPRTARDRRARYLAVRRGVELVLALLALVVLSPLLALIALIVRVTMGAPVIFRQQRPGLNGELFTLYKFRTMCDARHEDGTLRSDAERLTRVGRFLRSTSLDELPELINVVRGEMSLVGPRPLLPEYLPLYSPEQRRRHEVRPGLTGWAQVNGRNALTWPEKFALDVYYVDHVSWRLDLEIVARTVVQIVRRDGISHAGQATMEPFRGNDA